MVLLPNRTVPHQITDEGVFGFNSASSNNLRNLRHRPQFGSFCPLFPAETPHDQSSRTRIFATHQVAVVSCCFISRPTDGLVMAAVAMWTAEATIQILSNMFGCCNAAASDQVNRLPVS